MGLYCAEAGGTFSTPRSRSVPFGHSRDHHGWVQSYHFGPDSEMSGTTRCALNGHNSINNMFFSRFNDINLFLSIVSDCSVPPGVGPQGGLGRRRPPWLSTRSQSVVTRMAIKILIMKIYSSFKGTDTDLSRSMLANFVMPQRRDRGAMAAMGRRQPPWSGCIFLPSFRLANCVSEVCQPKNQQKPNH